MCGIVGMWSKESCDSRHLSQLVDRMLNVLIHRGPDDGGYCVGPNIAMGNRRLKIFDLSDAGNQPFFSDDGKIWLVLNGEIYNHYELRRELENEFAFRSTSDTEVLLRSYEKWGMKCLDRLIGMFAFAIWDARDHKLILCRDRLGIKPLYYYFNSKMLIFASEIKVLLAAGVEAVPNLNVIRDYLTSGYYDHTEQTFFKGVSQVKQGRFLTVNANNVTETCYWDLIERIGEENKEPKDAEEVYWEVLQDAIRLRMRADVPYAVCFREDWTAQCWLIWLINMSAATHLMYVHSVTKNHYMMKGHGPISYRAAEIGFPIMSRLLKIMWNISFHLLFGTKMNHLEV